MGKGLKLCALVLGCGLVFGCAAQKRSEDEQARVERFRHSYEVALSAEQTQAGQKLLEHAHSAIGTPYVRGGSAPGGFDCSGFVSWAYKNIGVTLPRTAREQSVVGERINSIEDMRAGDIVAFRHPKRGYHTGIYVGEGKFIHSPRKRTRVRINSLSDPYFSKTLLGARRVNLSSGENLVAQAESRLGLSSRLVADATPARAMTRSAGKTAAKTVSRATAKTSAKNATVRGGKKAALDRKGSKTQAARGKTAQKSAQKSVRATASRNTTDKHVRNAGASRAKATSVARNARSASKKNTQKTISSLQHKSRVAARGRS